MNHQHNIPKQFSQNFGVMNQDDYDVLSKSRVLIVGLGGLGTHVVNGLVRLGLTLLHLVDYDRFETSNLNRQLFSNLDNIGSFKVDVVKEELHKINQECNITVVRSHIQEVPFSDIKQFDYVIDAVDDIETKIYLSKLAEKWNVPLLHGACAGWYGQVGWIMPQNHLLEQLYELEAVRLDKAWMNPPFTPAITASYMIAEFLKMIQQSPDTVINELLLIDVFQHSLLKTGKHQDGR